MIKSITYYDWSTLLYTSVFVKGLQQNAKSAGYTFHISNKLPEFMAGPEFELPESFLRQSGFKHAAAVVLNCTGLFKVCAGDEEFFFCTDAGDHCEQSVSDTGVHYGYHLPLLRKVRFYFKVNYNHDSLMSNRSLKEYLDKIIPVPIVYPISIDQNAKYIVSQFKSSILYSGTASGIRRLKDIVNLTAMVDVKKYRFVPKELDTIFVVNHYDNQIHQHENEFRYEMIAKLRESAGIKALTGFASNKALPGKYEKYRVDRYRLNDYLKALAKSRVGIYVRGVHHCLSFKLATLFEMGLPVIGQSLHNNQEFFLSRPHIKEQFSYETPDEILAGLQRLIGDCEKIAQLSEANRDFFDENLTPALLANRVIRTICDRVH